MTDRSISFGDPAKGEETVQTVLANLHAVDYDVLAASDDTRLARDQFFWEVKQVAIIDGSGRPLGGNGRFLL